MNILKLEGIGIKIGGYLSNTQIVEITEKKKQVEDIQRVNK